MGRLLSDPFPPIAVVGLGALFPGGSGAQSFWANIVQGRDLISDVPPTHWLTEDFYNADPTTRDKAPQHLALPRYCCRCWCRTGVWHRC